MIKIKIILKKFKLLLKNLYFRFLHITFKNRSSLFDNTVSFLKKELPPYSLKLYDIDNLINLKNLDILVEFLEKNIFSQKINFRGETIQPFGYSSNKADYLKIEGRGADKIVKEIINFEKLNKKWNSYGLKLIVNRFSATRNYICTQKDNNPYSDEWHFDMFNPNFIMCFINLKDVNIDNGPFCYMNSKITNKYIRKLDLKGKLESNLVPQNDFFELTGKKGRAIIIHNPSILHRASYVKKGYRDMAIIWFKIKRI